MDGILSASCGLAHGASFKPFDVSLEESGRFPLHASGIKVVQVNMGRLCNQACRHCHVEAGPSRTESMRPGTVDMILEVVNAGRYPAVDVTGGAPEMNPDYRRLVKGAALIGCRVKTRTNLTILIEDGYGHLPGFWREHGVEVIASLPYYLEDTTDRQRGKGVYARSIEALKALNAAGYGTRDGAVLNLVYNPCGAFFPPPQGSIEADFRRELEKRHGITFTGLYALTNMPVGRFLKFLKDSGNLKRYLGRLLDAYNPLAAESVMCRETLSIGWDGSLYDCDFNQMLGLKCGHGAPDSLVGFDLGRLMNRRIVTGLHCYGCTAGAGSSCTGAVA